MKAKNKLWEWCLRLEHHLCPDYCGVVDRRRDDCLRPFDSGRNSRYSLPLPFVLHNESMGWLLF